MYCRYGTTDKCTPESCRCTTLGTPSSRWKRLRNTTCCTKGKRFHSACLNFFSSFVWNLFAFFYLFSVRSRIILYKSDHMQTIKMNKYELERESMENDLISHRSHSIQPFSTIDFLLLLMMFLYVFFCREKMRLHSIIIFARDSINLSKWKQES